MSNHDLTGALLMIALMISGCLNADDGTRSASLASPVSGGVAVGISPRVLYAEKGENISFTVYLRSTENMKDMVTIGIEGTWINRTMDHEMQAGSNVSVPVTVTVPTDAVNMSFRVKAAAKNLNTTSSTTGMIIIKNTGGK